MTRPKKSRKVCQPPIMKGYKPFGIPMCKIESIQLSIEEHESIRLVNYEMLSQEEAAIKMNVSRPTLTRIYNKALKIIAKAFIEGKAILIEGGNYEFDNEWYRCQNCHNLIEGNTPKKCKKHSDCNSSELIKLNN